MSNDNDIMKNSVQASNNMAYKNCKQFM